MLQEYNPANANLLVNINGTLVHRDEAGVSPFDSSVQNGDAVWEGLRLYGGRIFKLREHLARLRRSAEMLAYQGYPSDENLVAVNEKGEVFNSTCASTTSNDTAVAPSESSGSASTTSPSSPSSPASKSPVSTIVGPVVGGIAGVVLLIALGVFLWMRSRKNKTVSAIGSSEYVHDPGEKPIPLYSYSAADRDNSTHELWGNPVNELSGQITPKEKTKRPTAVPGVHEIGDSY